MPTRRASAGILLYRESEGVLEVLLVHPGGPFWRSKDDGAWSIPKGEIAPGEEPEAAARREFAEETGAPASGVAIPLGEVRQRGGKTVVAFALRGDFDVATLRSSTFPLEWPPRSGRQQEFPEVDRAAWLPLDAARTKILAAQEPFLERLKKAVDRRL